MQALEQPLADTQRHAQDLLVHLAAVQAHERALADSRAALSAASSQLQGSLASLHAAVAGGGATALALALDPSGGILEAAGVGSAEWRLGRLLASLAMHAAAPRQALRPLRMVCACPR
jgi:hypothetical protein